MKVHSVAPWFRKLTFLATSPPQSGTAPPQPEITETNCSPSCSQVIGWPTTPEPVWKLHSSLPVASSNAMNLPSGVPVNTSPPAVDITPPQSGASFLNSHTHSPVAGSIALRLPM